MTAEKGEKKKAIKGRPFGKVPSLQGSNNVYFDQKEMKGAGRPEMMLNERGIATVDKLAQMGALKGEIYAFLDVAANTIVQNEYNRTIFEDTYGKGIEKHKLRIRKAQSVGLERANPQIVIFMSKAVLGMYDGQSAGEPNTMMADFVSQMGEYAKDDEDDTNASD